MATTTATIIIFEFIALLALVIGFVKYDAKLRAWEDRQIRRVKRWACKKLADDGIYAVIGGKKNG